ncbi:hypothetical protein TorRG33x02_038630 [Trema orientale]|uniref:Uncharacterized protein n=1 Tax=Trema orientale TaxID=63057 RepID=A0A2P5FRP1_TREOI|nr:hypothetical protein TorRG33x02_038630 [Trema orientale]
MLQMQTEVEVPYTMVKVLDIGDIQGPLTISGRAFRRLHSFYRSPARILLLNGDSVYVAYATYQDDGADGVATRLWRAMIGNRRLRGGQCLVLVDQTGVDDGLIVNGVREPWDVYNARIRYNSNGVADSRSSVVFRVSVFGLVNAHLTRLSHVCYHGPPWPSCNEGNPISPVTLVCNISHINRITIQKQNSCWGTIK